MYEHTYTFFFMVINFSSNITYISVPNVHEYLNILHFGKVRINIYSKMYLAPYYESF